MIRVNEWKQSHALPRTAFPLQRKGNPNAVIIGSSSLRMSDITHRIWLGTQIPNATSLVHWQTGHSFGIFEFIQYVLDQKVAKPCSRCQWRTILQGAAESSAKRTGNSSNTSSSSTSCYFYCFRQEKKKLRSNGFPVKTSLHPGYS